MNEAYVPTRHDIWTRFFRFVDFGSRDDCWTWLAYCDPLGYGKFAVKTVLGWRSQQAHRWAYEFMVSPIPDGLQLDHLCRNPSCVNPRHLEPVTARENQLRGNSVAGACARMTECVNGHPFTEENTYRSTRFPNKRRCRACNREAQRRRSHRGGEA